MVRRDIIYDKKKKIYRMVWIVESTCPLCECEIETVFDAPPSEVQILEAQFFPCEDCLEEYERRKKKAKTKSRPSTIPPPPNNKNKN